MSENGDALDLPPIVTVLTPAERVRVDAAGQGCYQAFHRENLEEVIRDLKTRQIHAILVSVNCGSIHATRVASLVREFPQVPTLALLSELGAKTPHAVLAFGYSGIRRLVDVRSIAGWQELRGALMLDSSRSILRGILGQLTIDLAGSTDDCLSFFETLFTCSPQVGNIRKLAKVLGVLPSTMMSRFTRAGVPAPKQYLAMARLVRAAHLFENSGFSIANVANHLDYSSPQSFGRHVRGLLRVTAGEFRECYDGAGMFERFRTELIVPYASSLRVLHPVQGPLGWLKKHSTSGYQHIC